MTREPDRARSLERLTTEIGRCRVCVDAPAGQALPHAPRPVLAVSTTARICVCGQAPGTRVHASGRPFTDPSGDRLRDWMGIDETEFYDAGRVAIVPMGFCFPGLDSKGGDLPPRRECRVHWHGRVFEAMPQLELILLVGRYAQRWHLAGDAATTLTETVRDWRRHLEGRPGKGPRLLPLPHPSWRNNAWLRKNPWFERDVIPRLREEVAQRLAQARAPA